MAGLVYAYITEFNTTSQLRHGLLQMDNAIKFANKCSTQVVQKKGTAKINKKEL
jgi:bifunctional ADP-heptose synthase (sugar kinase/adenylyltransferase)